MKTKLFLAYLLFICSYNFLIAQKLKDRCNSYNSLQPLEELYAITDRDIYISGEEMFVKIHKINTLTNQPSNINKVVYVELLNSANNAVVQKMVKSEKTYCTCSFRLPDTLSSGHYIIRTYTKVMRNFSPALYFHNAVLVINPFSVGKFNNFLVEETKKSNHNLKNKNFTSITDYSIDIKSTHNELICRIENKKGIDNRHKSYLIAQKRGVVLFLKKIDAVSDSIVWIEKNIFPAGTIEFLLTDEKNVLARTFFYKPPNGYLNISVHGIKNSYSPREKVNLSVSVKDKNNYPTETQLCITVVKSCFIHDSDNQKKTMLTNSFRNPEKLQQTPIHSAYNEQNFLHQNNITYHYLPEFKNHIISGKIKNSDGKISANKDFVLSIAGKKALCCIAKTDSSGRINFPYNCYGKKQIVINPLDISCKENYRIEFEHQFSKQYLPIPKNNVTFDYQKIEEINQGIINMQIEAVYNKYKTQDSVVFPEKQHSFYGVPEYNIVLNEFIELNSIQEIIKEIVPDVLLRQRKDSFILKMINPYTMKPFDNGPFILVDGIPVSDANEIARINPKKLEKIEFTPFYYFLNKYQLNGIIHFVSKKGNPDIINLNKNAFTQIYQGYAPGRSFYEPDYSTIDLKRSRIPDYRNTLYWNPNAATNEHGNADVSFFTSDEATEYFVIIEAIGNNGKTGYAKIPLLVKEKSDNFNK